MLTMLLMSFDMLKRLFSSDMNKNKQKGTRLENRVVRAAKARGMEARKQPLSGQLKDFPGDCLVVDSLIECKTGYTTERTFHLNFDWLDQIIKQAKDNKNRLGALVFRPDGTNK